MKNNISLWITGIACIAILALGALLLNQSEKQSLRKKHTKLERIAGAIEQEYEKTKDPATGEVPRERLLVAKQYADRLRSMPRHTRGAIAGIEWRERGPNNVSGRTRAILIDANDATGNTVWAGGVGGGLWKCLDAFGATPSWTAVSGVFEGAPITCIAQDPSNAQNIYFGTGEGWFMESPVPGLGLWKSSDGGASWSKLTSTNNNTFHFAQKIVVNGSGHVFVTTRGGGLQRSTNGGASWLKVLGNGVGTGATDLAADVEVASNGNIYCSLGIGLTDGLYKSTDGGANWVKLAGGLPVAGYERIEIAVAPSNSDRVYALFQDGATDDCSGIYRSSDAGATWTGLGTPTAYGMTNFCRGQAWYDLIAAVDPNDEDRIFIGGIDLLASDDAGGSFHQISQWEGVGFQYVHADQHAIVFQQGNSNRIFFGNDGGIYRTTNGTAMNPNISFISDGYNVTQFYGADLHPGAHTNEYIAGAQDNGTQRFTMPGINNTTTVIGGDGGFCHIDKDQPNIQIGSYIYSDYNITNDSWASDIRVFMPGDVGSFINPTDYDSDNNILYGGSYDDEYSYVTDVGNTNVIGSRLIPIPIIAGAPRKKITAVRVSPNVNNRVYFGLDDGSIVKVDNANNGTTAGLVMPITAGYITCITVEEGNEDHMLVTFGNYGATTVNIFETSNGGANWTSVEGNLPDMPVRWAEFVPGNADQALIATDLGVWSTDDIDGATTDWGPTNGGLANTRIDMLAWRSSDKEVIAATHGRGLYSTDGLSDCPAPTNLTVTGITNNSVTLNWTASSNATNYTIEYRLNGASSWTPATSNATGTSHNLGGLNPSTNYNWRIRSNCSGSNSAFVEGPDLRTTGPTCDAPMNLVTSGVTNNSVTFSWDPVPGALSYNIQYMVAGGTIWTTIPFVNGASFTLPGLTFSTTYSWQVISNCNQNSSAATAGNDFTTLGPTCDAPANLIVSNLTTNSVDLSWDPAAGVANYTVEYRIAGSASWTVLGSAIQGTNASINGLIPNTTYNWQVRTNCSFNSSPYTGGPDFTTLLITKPCANAVSAFPYTNNFEAGLGWANTTTGDDFDWTHHSGPTNSTNTGPAAAAEGKSYGYMEVSAPNYPGKVAILNGPCLDLTSVSNPVITFQYHMLGGNSGAPGTLILEVSPDGANWTTVWSENGNQGSSWLPGQANLTPFTNETQLRIRYRGTSGKSWQGDMCLDDIRISDPGKPCGTPIGLLASNITNTSASLNWNPVPDAQNYDVRYRLSGTTTWTDVVGITGTSTNLTGLATGATYEWEVRTNCRSGASSVYTGSTFMTSFNCVSTVTSYPYHNDFEKELGWVNELLDDFDWTRKTGGTPSSNTGPVLAAQGLWYAYMEVSNNNHPTKTAILNGPCFNLTPIPNPEISFQYHMLGGYIGNPGTLYLEASTNGTTWNTLWSESGNQGSLWNVASASLSSYTNQTGLRLRFRGVSGTSWQGDICIDDIVVQNVTSNNCPPIDFTLNGPISYGGTNDHGVATVLDAGATIKLQNDAWKAINMNYTVTANTVLEFEFRSTLQGEIHAIGFDNDNSLSSNTTFKVHGTQNWGTTNYNNYSPSTWKSYSIPVGTFFTGSFSKLIFVADHDLAPNNGDAWFRNVTVHEGNCGGLAMVAFNARPIVPVIGDEDEYVVSAYPNPFNDLVYLDVHGIEGEVTVEIFDAMGKKVWQETGIQTDGRTGLRPDISRGMYVLRVSNGSFRKDIKLVKAK